MELTKKSLEVAGVLRRLLRQRYFLRQKNEKWFQILVDHREEVDLALKPFLARLYFNEANGLAFIQTLNDSVEEELDFPLGRKNSLGILATIMLLELRRCRLEHFKNPYSESLNPIIGLQALRGFLEGFQNFKSDRQFEVSFRKALEDLIDLQVIYVLPQDQPYYEITPICDLLLPVDEMQRIVQKIEVYFDQKQGLKQELELG